MPLVETMITACLSVIDNTRAQEGRSSGRSSTGRSATPNLPEDCESTLVVYCSVRHGGAP